MKNYSKIHFIFFLLNNLMFNFFNHPLMLSLILFLKTLLICLIMTKIYYYSWFSFILFLIFIGGILILLMYMISLIKTEKFYIMKSYLILYLIISFMVIYMFILNLQLDLNNFSMCWNMVNYNPSLNMNKLYNFPTNIINIFLIFYLFFMMVITVKISNLFKGPLRMK